MDIESIINEESSTDGSIIQGTQGHSRTSSNASSQLSEKFNHQMSIDGGNNFATSETLERDMRDSRAQKMKQIMKREAPC